jgi:hypothetical protein
MLRKGQTMTPADVVSPEEELKDPYVLEFLNLKDEYSETELETALIAKLETFLLELGGDFTFVGRQRRLRVGDEWYRIDLLFFHRVARGEGSARCGRVEPARYATAAANDENRSPGSGYLSRHVTAIGNSPS